MSKRNYKPKVVYQVKNENSQQNNNQQNDEKDNRNNNNYQPRQEKYKYKLKNEDEPQLASNRNNRQSGRSSNKRYPEYYNAKQVQKGLENGTLFKGLFIANEKSNMYGQIKCENFDKRVYVNTQIDINRALHKSEVVFRLKTQEEITEMEKDKQIQKLLKEQRLEEQLRNPNKTQKRDQKNTKKVLYIVKKEEKEEEDEDDVQRVGEIVYIQENPWKNQNIVGQINRINIYNPQEVEKQQKEKEKQDQLNEQEQEENKSDDENCQEQQQQDDQDIQDDDDNNKNTNNNKKQGKGPQGFWFYPVDKRLPKMYIRSFQDTELKDMSDEELHSYYYTGKIIDWTQYTHHPDIHLQEKFGKVGDIEIECQAILRQNDILETDFSEETEKYLKENVKLDENGQYIITEEERKKRMDLTKDIICTIDPATAKDLDDALSIKKISDEIYEVGVHIADVSHFVDENSPLEEDAKMRTTSVYLTHRVIPMLPRLLCENLCSLNPDVERLAFSIFFQINKETGDIDFDNGVRYGKSIIKSCAKMSYETAQKIIDGTFKSVDEVPEELLPNKSVNLQEWFDNIKIMNILAEKRKKTREDKGSFEMAQRQKLSFELDEKLWPVKYTIQDRKEAHKMIEEMMVTANCLAAYKVAQTDRNLAVIRRHSFPTLDKQVAFMKKIDHICQFDEENRPFELDFGNANALRDSIEEMRKNENLSENAKAAIQFYLIKLLEAAEYKITESSNEDTWRHFGLQTEIYTHFTSPIRRYPDILAHRLLYKCLIYGKELEKHVDVQDMKGMLEICNEKKLQAKRVSDGCSKIFMCLYLKNHSVNVSGIITGFSERGMSIIVPDYDIEKDIPFREFKSITNVRVIEENQKENIQKQLVIQYSKDLLKQVDDQAQPQELRFFNLSNIQIQLTATDKFPIDYKVTIIGNINNQEILLK